MSRPYVGPAIHLRLTEQLLADLDAEAERAGVTRAVLVRELLAEGLERRRA